MLGGPRYSVLQKDLENMLRANKILEESNAEIEWQKKALEKEVGMLKTEVQELPLQLTREDDVVVPLAEALIVRRS